MSSATTSGRDDDGSQNAGAGDPNLPTVAAFSPVTLSHASSANKQRSTILVHQKSPLLIATPPQITRALAYSHPFLLPLNKFVGLLTWTSGDPWESFLLLAAFWAVIIYGDVVMRWAGPVVIVLGLILGMYSRRYSPLSSSSWTGEKLKKGHKREDSEATNIRHQKTLDEIVETLKVFTSRCNVLLDPLLELTDFLSTQRTATSATTRPALTTLFIRILLITPLWILLALPPIHIITTKRILLVTGTIFFTWHSRPARVSRIILWRSALVRRICTMITGLQLTAPPKATPPSLPDRKINGKPPLPPRGADKVSSLSASTPPKRRPDASGIRFTFILYENQRRWLGLGWTSSMLLYERAAWTDEHQNPAPSKDEFELPDVEGGNARWRWVEGSQWLVEGAGETDEGGSKAKDSTTDGGQGWIYYDNKWQNGRRGQDGWGKYTRRRKWYRDAELVEVTPSTEITPTPSPSPIPSSIHSNSVDKSTPSKSRANSSASAIPSGSPPRYSDVVADDSASVKSSKSSGFRPRVLKRTSTSGTVERERTSDMPDEDEGLPGHGPIRERDGDWGIGDDARMGLE